MIGGRTASGQVGARRGKGAYRRFEYNSEGHHYPWEPVIAYLERRWPELGQQRRHGGPKRTVIEPDGMPETTPWDVLGLNKRTYHRWRELALDDDRADYIATQLGVNHNEFWSEWYLVAREDHTVAAETVAIHEYKCVLTCKCGTRIVEYERSEEKARAGAERKFQAHTVTPGLQI